LTTALDFDKQFLPAYDRAFAGPTGTRPRPNPDQRRGILDASGALFLVAGPGSGKTTVLALRVLKQLFCDQIPPNAILATTFTVKAAAELRSRLLGWGFAIRKELLADPSVSGAERSWLESLDINQVVTGTLDSICQQVLTEHRAPAEHSPVLIDDYLASTVMVRRGLLEGDRYRDADLDGWLMGVDGTTGFGWNLGRKRQVLSTIWDRLQQDLTDVHALAATAGVPAAVQPRLVAALAAYQTELDSRKWLDFGMLERRVLQHLRAGELDEWAQTFRSILVDEYQDTNILQEQIYFEILRRGGASITVVGDDDQSLYRFRGAAVELFSDFEDHLQAQVARTVSTVFMTINYRSTDPIIGFADQFIRRDAQFQQVRVRRKPPIVSPGPKPGLPVLGIFRGDMDSLTVAVAEFVAGVVSPTGFHLPGGDVVSVDHAEHGALGDLCFLTSSPAEFKRAAPARPGGPVPVPEERFPRKLREELHDTHRIDVFNPRGNPLGEVPVVQVLGGLLLEALDDRGMVQAADQTQRRLGPDAARRFPAWRTRGRVAARSNAELGQFVSIWQSRTAPAGYRWPRSVSVLELLYGLVHFLPDLHDDVEGQTYLEVFTRQLTAMSSLSKFEGRVVTDPARPGLGEASVRDLLCDWLVPIASDTVELDEDMIGSFPRDRLSILSIHQSKGLEFPLVMIDVGADFKTNHQAHAFKRHPREGSMSHTLEDLIRPLSGHSSSGRSQRDRAFDDLERLYYVGFTRAQQALILVGLDGSCPSTAAIPNIASGWDRAGARHGASWPIRYI
jgi:DNA helicase-2/ATP-dependent DNA helicase PcrA